MVAIDQLDMGYSERTGTSRRLAQRIDDLDSVIGRLAIEGSILLAAHDWGGPIAVGWALRNRRRVAGLVLLNTSLRLPAGVSVPRPIRLARSRFLVRLLTSATPAFVFGTTRFGGSKVGLRERRAYSRPYRTAARRRAIEFFVRDIPIEADHPSRDDLDKLVEDATTWSDVPVLIMWGSSDPVFGDQFLADLQRVLPQAAVHRYPGAGHLLPEDEDIATPIWDWLHQSGAEPSSATPSRPGQRLWDEIERRSDSDEVAIVEMKGAHSSTSISWRELARQVDEVAAGLRAIGVEQGDRVAALVPPGIDLTVCLFACWRMGAVTVIADAGLGVRGLGHAFASAQPHLVVGIPRGLLAAKTLGWGGKRILVGEATRLQHTLLGTTTTLADLQQLGAEGTPPDPPSPNSDAAILFTSGATGPAKGAVYKHRQLEAQVAALREVYAIAEGDSLVAAFAPFALYGPAMGMASAVPDMDVTQPGTLTASALCGAAGAIDATLVFASPAALVNVDKTETGVPPSLRTSLLGVRLLMSAGAPVPAELLRRVARLVPNAELHTPYGMTEVLPVADISLQGIKQAGGGNGVCVGEPVPGVEIAISPLDETGAATLDLTSAPGVSGEICIRAAHARERYDKLWATTSAASKPAGWHRSGDIGHLDDAGRLWVEGRMVHIIRTAAGVVTPVAIEHAVETVAGVTHAAAVGVGPPGTQQVVVVVATDERQRTGKLATLELSDAVRSVVSVDVAAVLTVPALPVDKRHNSKINRTRVAQWAERVLSGGKVGSP